MDEFHRASQERVNAFQIGEHYLVKHYFDDTSVFGELRDFYDDQHYRFEIPQTDFEEVFDLLAVHGYALVPVENLAPFVVVVEKYTEHPDDVFKQSVLHRSDAGYNFFLMKDQAAVEQVSHRGATPLKETDLVLPF